LFVPYAIGHKLFSIGLRYSPSAIGYLP
jgi:hypothetical protein